MRSLKPLAASHFWIGFVVDDAAEAMARWSRVYGVGPFEHHPRIQLPCIYREQPAHLDFEAYTACTDSPGIRLICDYTPRRSVFKDLADIYGNPLSGFTLLSLRTSEFDTLSVQYAKNDYELACELNPPGQRIAIYDTVPDFGFFTEVVEAVASDHHSAHLYCPHVRQGHHDDQD
ncbi:VOC family protein [Mycobacterium intracellulare]|uniref:VOC family protein n=1 Tax=Mycobacterium intracellulare TaxID=1767 RepID=UPI001EED647A|nr:VOC family protein [Mycobacterium intracellulare]MEE3751430.1 VOC family protein [Mycobacterium intracellulare]